MFEIWTEGSSRHWLRDGHWSGSFGHRFVSDKGLGKGISLLVEGIKMSSQVFWESSV